MSAIQKLHDENKVNRRQYQKAINLKATKRQQSMSDSNRFCNFYYSTCQNSQYKPNNDLKIYIQNDSLKLLLCSS